MNNLIPTQHNGQTMETVLGISSEIERVVAHTKSLPSLFNIYRDINRICKQIEDPGKLLERVCDKLSKYEKFRAVLIATLDQDEELLFYKKVDPDNSLAHVCSLLEEQELPSGYHESLTQLKSQLPSLIHGVAFSEQGHVVSALHYSDMNWGFVLILPNEKIDQDELCFIGDISSEVAFTLHNISLEQERQRASQKVDRDLREKDVLLAEIHHRVKNNLQIVSGLLYLQSRKTQDTDAKGILNESLNRVRSMALIHEQLYQSRDFSRINFKSYIERINRSLASAYSGSTMNVHVEVNMDEIYFGIDTAIPCGLIINELVSNCFKYAFPKEFGKRGIITISMEQEDGQIKIIVKDNGVGLPKNFQIGQSSSCGLEIVKMLSEEQLEGSLFIQNNNGAQFTLKFENPGFTF